MVRPVEVRPLARYRIWLRYQDGTEGEVDLSHLAGKGVFAAWEQEGVFARVKLGSHGQIEWPGEVDLCSDALYLTLTGKRAGEVVRVWSDGGLDPAPGAFAIEFERARFVAEVGRVGRELQGFLPLVGQWARAVGFSDPPALCRKLDACFGITGPVADGLSTREDA